MSSVTIGLSACAFSSLLFGSMFVPIKNYNAKDGVFSQWMMSIAILVVGFFVFAFTGFPGFYPLAMLGGMFWSIGISTAIPIISHLGMAVGILIWNVTNCLTGWAGGRFGLFGMKPQVPASPTLNYLGLVCVVIGGVLFSRVTSETSETSEKSVEYADDEKTKSKKNRSMKQSDGISALKAALNPNKKYTVDIDDEIEIPDEKAVKGSERMFACLAALLAGVFYGMTFVPVIHMIDNRESYPDHPTDGLAYVFSHYFGIFLTSTCIFVIYAFVKKNQPFVSAELCLPGLCSGFLWAIAQTSFFVANQQLSQTVTFPIITMMPGCIASAWSIFYYKEIQGRRNFMILGFAMIITLFGAVFVGLSKNLKY